MHILVTGGAGYIGSHTCVELLNAGHEVVVVDNFSNSNREALRRVKEITGKALTYYEVDLLDRAAIDDVFTKHSFDAVIHFAALKAVGESVKQPLEYYHNNVTGTLNLCAAMQEADVKNIVFSSSATVYGTSNPPPLREDAPRSIDEVTNPYGRSKLMIEIILEDVYASDPAWNVILLRYFNPAGAHPSGKIGEDPSGIPNNLTPYVAQVAVGKLDKLPVTGTDYDTPDGTGVRDYIHIVDLALGHVRAVDKLKDKPGAAIYNLGTGRGYSVFEVIKAFEKASGRDIEIEVKPRREGDIAINYADPSKAERELHWTAERDMDEMTTDAWRWQSGNPRGYESG